MVFLCLCLLAALCAASVRVESFDYETQDCLDKYWICDSVFYPGNKVTIRQLDGLDSDVKLDDFCRRYRNDIRCFEDLRETCDDPDGLWMIAGTVTFNLAVRQTLCSEEGRRAVLNGGECWKKDLGLLNYDCARAKKTEVCIDHQERKECKANTVRECGDSVLALVDRIDDLWCQAVCSE